MLSYILIIIIVLITILPIFKKIFNNKTITGIGIIKLNRNLYHIVIGFGYFISFIIFLYLSILESQNIYNLLKVEYLDFYRGSLPFNLFMTIFSLCYTIYYFNSWFQKDLICENGMIVDGNFIDWSEAVDYKWSNAYEKKIFYKGKYHNLIIILPKLLRLEREYKLIVNYDDRELVDGILKKHINAQK